MSLILILTVLAGAPEAQVQPRLEPQLASFQVPKVSLLSLGATGTPEKSVNALHATGEVLLGAAGGYLGLLVGLALNFPAGGLSTPPDGTDVVNLMLLPAAGAAVTSWLIGLLDLSQRSFFGSLFHATLGAVIGEAIGIGVGLLLGLASPFGLPAILWGVIVGPAFSALGATVAMEALKSGPSAATGIDSRDAASSVRVVGFSF